MMLIAKGAVAGLALAVSLAGASMTADARTAGHHHKHPANHGAAVSAVARSTSTTGEAHGDAVSAVARSDAGRSGTSAMSTQGNAVSTLATATTLSGEAKGDAVSALARNGHGKAK